MVMAPQASGGLVLGCLELPSLSSTLAMYWVPRRVRHWFATHKRAQAPVAQALRKATLSPTPRGVEGVQPPQESRVRADRPNTQRIKQECRLQAGTRGTVCQPAVTLDWQFEMPTQSSL